MLFKDYNFSLFLFTAKSLAQLDDRPKKGGCCG